MSNISRRGFFKTAAALSAMPLLANASESKKSLKFIHVTDSHMDMSNSDSVEAIELMVEYINKNYPELDFVLFGGDNFNNNVANYEDAKLFKKLTQKLKAQCLIVRGNKESSPHSLENMNNKEYQELFYTNKALVLNGNDWMVAKNGYVILGLDSCIDGQNNGRYTDETIAFAKKVLDKKHPTIILNHHPYTNYWKGDDPKDIHKYVLGNSKKVIDELFSYDNLVMTLSGHKHIDSVTDIKGTKAIVTRGFIRPLDLDMYPMRYVELSGDNITEKLIYTA